MNSLPVPAVAAPGYLATASHAPITACTQEGVGAWERSYVTARPWDAWAGELEGLRVVAARLLGSDPGEVALPASSCAGVAAFLSGLDLHDRTILVAGDAFPGLEQVCRARTSSSGRCTTVPFDDVVARVEAERPAVVILTHVDRSTGEILDVGAALSAARRVGAASVLDASHSLGLLAVPDADVVVASGYKFLFGIPGMAVMRVRSSWCSASRPSVTGWFAAERVLDLAPGYDPASSARRFEAGAPSFVAAFVLHRSIAALVAAAPEAAQHRARVRAACALLPGGDETERAFVSLEVPDGKAAAVLAGMPCTAATEGGRIRLAPSIANELGEVEALVEHLARSPITMRVHHG